MATNLTSTTLTALLNSGPNAQNNVIMASVTGMAAPTAGGGIQTMLLVDSELMVVESVNSTTLTASVQRGMNGTKVANHGNGAIVWFGLPQYFPQYAQTTFPSTQGRFRFFTATGIQGSLTGLGNSTADTAGGLFVADVKVDRLMVSTGAAVLNGATVGADSNAVYLYDYSGTLIASSAAAVTSGASAFQQRAWVQPTVLASGQYFIVYQTNGTTDNFQTIKTATWLDVVTETLTGTAGSPPNNITVPTTFTVNVGPISYLY
ncbi:MAG TPA: hypothetical protein VN950_22935 [Terriglobales bacterium]|nr:hypothetical protein [Terriglobales bacterium]